MIQKVSRDANRRKIHLRLRRKVRGTPERPRLAVFRSLCHIYAQLIDDTQGRTLASASTNEKENKLGGGGNLQGAKAVGKLIAERASLCGIRQVVFDRGGYLYHGRVRALGEAAREGGLEF